MDKLPTVSPPLEKYEYENAQYDPEVPANLDGVMKRWVVPEGEAQDAEPTQITVPRLEVKAEEEEISESPSSRIEDDLNTDLEHTPYLFTPFVFLVFFLFVLSLLGNIFFLFFRN